MNRKLFKRPSISVWILTLGCLVLGSGRPVAAQNFDFRKLENTLRSYSVIVDLKVELAFGTHSEEQEERLLGTIVGDGSMVVFDGSALSQDDALSMMAGFRMRTTPTSIVIQTFDDRSFGAEYLGTDRFTRLAFARIPDSVEIDLDPIDFAVDQSFQIGHWLALYMLLPEFVSPPLAADIGMISAITEAPEEFALIVGFSELELGSVLFDQDLRPVGVLGSLMNPGASRSDAAGLIESFGEFRYPLLGVITGERLQKLIADPPVQGKTDRAWLGITLQALTEDIAGFLDVDAPGGIIINDVVFGSPAEKAGLAVGDVIYAVGGQPVTVDREERLPIFQRAIAQMGPGTEVEFSVMRPGDSGVDSLVLLTVLDKAPLAPSDAPEYENKDLEFKVRDLVFADYLRLNQDQASFSGVVVSELQRGGMAMLGGIRLDDVIQRIGNVPVSSVDDIEVAMKQAKEELPGEVIFFIWRYNRTMFVNVKTDWD